MSPFELAQADVRDAVRALAPSADRQKLVTLVTAFDMLVRLLEEELDAARCAGRTRRTREPKSGQTAVEGQPYVYETAAGRFKAQPPKRPARTFATLDEAVSYRDTP